MAEPAGSITAGNGAAHINGKPNGQPLGRRTTRKRSSSFLLWTLSAVARLSTWAAILTILFRCPPSLESCDANAPFICKPYFRVKEVVSPHVQPYYDQYAAPYVDAARPYYEVADNKIWKPTRAYAIQYGAPWVEKAQEHARVQWEKNGQPQLVKYQDLAQEKYVQSLAPYVSQATNTVGPYYDIARTNALQVYYEYILPGYDFVHPYAIRGYDAASDFTTATALPTASWAWTKTYAFVNARVWPHLRTVYIENVEPQLVRIGERLGRFKARDKVKGSQDKVLSSIAADSTPSSFIKPAPQSTTSPQPTSEEPVVSQSAEPEVTYEDNAASKSALEPEGFAEQYYNPVQPPEAAENESEKRRKAREMVTQDLITWQNKFAAQADDGATDLEDRVDEIAKRMIHQNARTTGRELFDQLEATIELELQELRSKISSLVEVADERPDSVHGQVIDAIRSAGMAIKKRAQAIRQWRGVYDKELQNTVIAVADIHFQILDETRNLALQHIGMRWAWTEGVTYKDWAKYHELKATLNEWTEQLKQLIVTHPSLLEAQDASAQVEDEGMEIASVAAKELARLKDVARWKITARDATDNFDSEAMKLAAEAAEAAEAEAIKRSQEPEEPAVDQLLSDITESTTPTDALPTSTDAASTTTSAADSAFSEFDSLVEEAVHEPTSSVSDAPPVAAVIEEESETTSASSIEEEEPSNIPDEDAIFKTQVEHAPSSLADDTLERAKEAPSAATEPASSPVEESSVETPTSAEPEDATSTEFLVSEASEVILGSAQTVVSNDSQESAPVHEDEPINAEIKEGHFKQHDQKPLSEEEPVKPVMFGAMAQKVPNRQPVLEDYDEDDEQRIIAKATNAAQAAYSTAVSKASDQYTSALSVVSAQIYGTPKPVHGELLSSVSAAYQNAVSAAGDKLNSAVNAAASGIKGTPATTTTTPSLNWEHAESIAAQRLNEGRLWAEVQYQSALIALGWATATPTPSSGMEKYYERVKFNYYAGLGIAQDRYNSFVASASSAFSSLTASPTPTPTATNLAASASSIASKARDSAASAISGAGSSIASAVKAVDDSVSSVVDSANEQISNAGLAFADTWSNAIAEISAQVYGEPTHTAQIAWYEHIFSDVSSYAAAATSAVSDKAKSASDSAVTASADASKQYKEVNKLVSELVSGKEPSFTQSVFSRLQAAYATAAASVESLANVASQATEAVKEKVQPKKDEL